MWPFNKKKEEYKRGKGDNPIDGHRYMVISVMSTDEVEAEYNDDTNEYRICKSGITVKQEDWKIIREV